jgi:hypothetical protein
VSCEFSKGNCYKLAINPKYCLKLCLRSISLIEFLFSRQKCYCAYINYNVFSKIKCKQCKLEVLWAKPHNNTTCPLYNCEDNYYKSIQAFTLTYFSTCLFGHLTKKNTCPTHTEIYDNFKMISGNVIIILLWVVNCELWIFKGKLLQISDKSEILFKVVFKIHIPNRILI